MSKKTEKPAETPEELITDHVEDLTGIDLDLSAVAGELIAEQPAPTEGVESPLITNDSTANEGERTDPNNHANSETQPKRRGRPPKAAPKSTLGGAAKPAAAPAPEQVVSVHKEVAGVTAGLFFTLGTMVGGKEWMPDADEQFAVSDAFEKYFQATGRTDLPPVLGLVAVLGFYSAKRFAMPETQKRTSGLISKIKAWWINRKLKKLGMKAENITSTEKE